MPKSDAQIAYEVGAAWLDANMRDEQPSLQLRPWESIREKERAYWEAVTKALREKFFTERSSGQPHLVEFGHRYYNRNLDTSVPGEKVMSYLIGRCEHYSENEAGDGPGVRCELCGADTPLGESRETLAAVLTKLLSEDAVSDDECNVCGELGGQHRSGCPSGGGNVER